MVKQILVIQLRQLGDILLTTPCARELKQAYPGASITFLCHPMGKMILEGNPSIDHIVTYDPKDSWRSEWTLLRNLHKQNYDLVLDFMYNPRSAIYAFATRSPRRLAFPSRRSMFFTEIVPKLAHREYIVREKFLYLRALGLEPRSERLDLPWCAEHARWVTQWMQNEASFREASLRVILSPTHRREVRQWPLERFARLADRLQSEWGATPIWVWGPGEEDFVREVQRLCERPSLLAPKSSFREMAALIAHADLFVGNSNGPSHVAVASDTPSLQLHGPTFALSWCPCTERHKAVQADSSNLMTSVSEADVWRAMEELRPLAEASAKARGQTVRSHWQEPRGDADHTR